MMTYKVSSRAFDLRGELSDIMSHFGIEWYGFKNSVGSKIPTFYSDDPKMEAVVGHQILTDKHRIFITLRDDRFNQYLASFQPILYKQYRK